MTLSKSENNLTLPIVIFLIAISTKIIPSFLQSLTADACIYLDIGRNFFSGRGFNISYNLYDFWSGQNYYPALPLFPPLFPFIAGIVWKLFHSIQATILLNVFIAGINSVLLFYILGIVYNNIKISFWAAVLFSISVPMQQTSMFSWSEQLSLLFILIAVLMFVKDFSLSNTRLIKIGVILGMGTLARADVNLIILAFLFFILLSNKLNRKSIISCGYLILGILIILVPYELICILRYKLFYPAYTKVNSIGYIKAIFQGGYYDTTQLPVFRANVLPFWQMVLVIFKRLPFASEMFWKSTVNSFGFLIYFLILRVLLIFRNELPKERFLFIIGAISLITHIIFFSYQYAFTPIDITRFSILHFALFIPLSLAAFYDFCGYLKKEFKIHQLIVYFSAIAVVILSMGQFCLGLHSNYSNIYRNVKIEDSLKQSFFASIKSRAKQDDLIAIAGNLVQSVFTLDRPTVWLPMGKSLNSKNINDFLRIYKPSFIIMGIDAAGAYTQNLSPYISEIGEKEKWHIQYRLYAVDYSKL